MEDENKNKKYVNEVSSLNSFSPILGSETNDNKKDNKIFTQSDTDKPCEVVLKKVALVIQKLVKS